ncbi:hypothetical protein CD113_09555 [Staphylococcus simiae]|nr:hypothetical protein CD113_09555 [Staphylococcus simiae]
MGNSASRRPGPQQKETNHLVSTDNASWGRLRQHPRKGPNTEKLVIQFFHAMQGPVIEKF